MKKNQGLRAGTSVAETLERVLDQGLVIDAWVQVSVVGVKLIDLEARVVVASISGYVRHAQAVSDVRTVSRPQIPGSPRPMLIAETPPALPPARRRRRAAPRLSLRLGRCGDGCTFLKRFRSSAPVSVRCPYRGGRVCKVAPG